MCPAVRPYCCTDCTENPAAASPQNLRSFASKSVPKLIVRLLYGFPEICTTKQQSLSSISVPRICPELNAEAAVRFSLKTVPLSLEKCAQHLLYGFLPWNPCLLAAVRTLLKFLSAALFLLSAQKSPLLSFSCSLNLLMKE